MVPPRYDSLTAVSSWETAALKSWKKRELFLFGAKRTILEWGFNVFFFFWISKVAKPRFFWGGGLVASKNTCYPAENSHVTPKRDKFKKKWIIFEPLIFRKVFAVSFQGSNFQRWSWKKNKRTPKSIPNQHLWTKISKSWRWKLFQMAHSACINAKDEEYHLDLRLGGCVLCACHLGVVFCCGQAEKRIEIHDVTYGSYGCFLLVFIQC